MDSRVLQKNQSSVIYSFIFIHPVMCDTDKKVYSTVASTRILEISAVPRELKKELFPKRLTTLKISDTLL